MLLPCMMILFTGCIQDTMDKYVKEHIQYEDNDWLSKWNLPYGMTRIEIKFLPNGVKIRAVRIHIKDTPIDGNFMKNALRRSWVPPADN